MEGIVTALVNPNHVSDRSLGFVEAVVAPVVVVVNSIVDADFKSKLAIVESEPPSSQPAVLDRQIHLLKLDYHHFWWQ